MHLKWLKWIRVVVSLLFFTLILLLFLDFSNSFTPAVGDIVLYPQFIPSLLKFTHGAVLGATGFIGVLLITFAAGRLYCSTLCPLGTLQDLAGFAFADLKRSSPVQNRQFTDILRYSVLFLTVFLVLAGSNLLLNFLDPFSTFGRIATSIAHPVGIGINNGGAMVLEKFGIYSLARENLAAVAPLSTGVAAAMLLLVCWLAVAHGRLYCNSICPVGTFLGLVAGFSVLRLHLDGNFCTGCKRCEDVCKAGCIDLAAKTVDMSRCVSCFNCLSACKNDGIRFHWRRPEGQVEKPDPGKRKFLLNSGACILALTGWTAPARAGNSIRKIVQSKPTTIPVVMTSPVSPPGSLGVARFSAACSACHLCVSACPSRILLPSFLEYGLSGLMQPHMNFQKGYCNYECTICMDVCPTGAMQPLAVEEKKLNQVGTAKFIKENCVVYTDNTACGACSEHCPTKAVNMVPYANPVNRPLVIPEVNEDYCVGCGACEYACPTRPYKAIFVDGNPVHKTARKPKVKKVDQEVDFKEDFPF